MLFPGIEMVCVNIAKANILGIRRVWIVNQSINETSVAGGEKVRMRERERERDVVIE